MSRKPLRERVKGSELDTNQKQLTDNDKRLYHEFTCVGTLELSIINQTVYITNSYPGWCVLPPVREAKGLTFTITIDTDLNDIVVTDYPSAYYSDSVDWGGDYNMTTAGDSITLRSNGSSWIVVSNDIQ